jgi:hypothetical protein
MSQMPFTTVQSLIGCGTRVLTTDVLPQLERDTQVMFSSVARAAPFFVSDCASLINQTVLS